jgi:hypothetical protein
MESADSGRNGHVSVQRDFEVSRIGPQALAYAYEIVLPISLDLRVMPGRPARRFRYKGLAVPVERSQVAAGVGL